MKIKLLSKFFYVSISISCMLTFSLFAQGEQTGILKGRVIESGGKSALPFANVLVDGTNNGVATDNEGYFVLRNVNIGKQKIKISYIGYESIVEEVTIVANQTTEANFVLTDVRIETEEIEITAQRKGQLDALNQQINSNSIKNVVASDRLQQNPDANIAEALGRLPGISLNRTGGEGTGIVIRGLDPKYSKILIDGVALSSTDASNRGTDISGISQYMLGGAEVFKSITPDMEGDATAGAINLRLGGIPEGLNFNVQVLGGYNDLNKYWQNYKFQANISNRFFDNELGISLNISSENVNRSAQTMEASYAILTSTTTANQFQNLYVNNIILNNVYRLNNRNAGTLMFDFNVTPNSKIMLSNFFSSTSSDKRTVSKNHDFNTSNLVSTFNENLGSKSELFLSSLKSENKFDLFELNAGISYTQTHNYIPDSKGWSFSYPNAIPSAYLDTASRHLPLETLMNLVSDNAQGGDLRKQRLSALNRVTEDNIERQIAPYIDVKIPFKISDDLNGNIKLGAKYKNNYRTRYYELSAPDYFAAKFGDYAVDYLPWIDTLNGVITAKNFEDYFEDEFLNNQFKFGWFPNFDRLNEYFDFYKNTSEYYMSHPEIPSPFPEIRTYFRQNATIMQQTNYKFNENYLGLYIMSDINIGDFVYFFPGVRYEKVVDDLWGWYTEQLFESTKPNGHETVDTHSDEYFLANMQLKIKPTKWMNIFFAYTNTLNRPDYSSLVPIIYINTNGSPQTLNTGNPELKPEFWSNFELQVAIFGNEIGYLGVTGFYKKVENMIWSPLITRTSGDPLIPGYENTFGPDARVNITKPVNHDYDVFIKGLEFEWQTSLWYLPEPFSFFTLNINYTLMDASTKYPRAETINTKVGVDDRGRPIYKLITTYYVDEGPMLNQPDDILNCSLGFNYEGLNVWLSYSFTGVKLLSYSQQLEKNISALSFSRYDLQVTQALPLKGFELILNFANFNNPTETSKQTIDVRPTYLESYGWTADFGLRYKL